MKTQLSLLTKTFKAKESSIKNVEEDNFRLAIIEYLDSLYTPEFECEMLAAAEQGRWAVKLISSDQWRAQSLVPVKTTIEAPQVYFEKIGVAWALLRFGLQFQIGPCFSYPEDWRYTTYHLSWAEEKE